VPGIEPGTSGSVDRNSDHRQQRRSSVGIVCLRTKATELSFSLIIMVVVVVGLSGVAGGAGCSRSGAGKIKCNCRVDITLFNSGWHGCIPLPWP
jgi:hypothetical protein